MKTFISSLILASAAAQKVTLPSEVTLQGRTCPDKTDIRCFWGIPYAEPPTGQRRFKPPQAYDYDGEKEYDATYHGPKCY